jgi:hypothetical protein
MDVLDLGPMSDGDLNRAVDDLTSREKAISAERRLLHDYLRLLGVDRATQTTGIPLDGWPGSLVARENRISYERSLLQARLDILRAAREERKSTGSRAALGIEALTRALTRHGRGSRPTRRLGSLPTSP